MTAAGWFLLGVAWAALAVWPDEILAWLRGPRR